MLFFLLQILDLDILDEVIPVHSDEAVTMANELWMIGLPVGVSSGGEKMIQMWHHFMSLDTIESSQSCFVLFFGITAIVAAATKVCARPESAGKMVVAVIPSFGERYFTHPMFGEIKDRAESLTKQPLPEPFDNREYGFATERG